MSEQNQNDQAQSPYVNWTSDEVRKHLLFEIARRYKGLDPVVDAKIDAAAELISGHPGIKSIPAVVAGEPRVPLYAEGEPGVGKTTLIRSAIQEFCRITGLNFVENPSDDYVVGPNDFYYCTVNLSGKTNPMDIGGLPSKGELATGVEARRRSTNAGAWLAAEFESRLRALAGFAKLGIGEPVRFAKGSLDTVELTVRGETEAVDAVVRAVVGQLGEEVKKHGAGLALLREGDEPQEGRLALQYKKGAGGARVCAYIPHAADNDAQYVAEMLPNRRFAVAKNARFSLFNFDDVANASEGVRNVLLEIAQSGRYSGVADLGNAMVTFTGNMGAEDNTNTMSEQSDAELTRVLKVRVRDTPADWAKRTAIKYAAVGDCMFSSFVHRFGNEDGIFRDAVGDGRTARGVPKPNSRSLENALAKVLPYFQMAKDSGISPTVFTEQIRTMVKGTAGGNVATRYIGFMKAMLNDAVPLADAVLNTGKLDQDKLSKSLGNGVKATEKDFEFAFGAALADAFVHRVAFSGDAKAVSGDQKKRNTLVAESTKRLCLGLSQVEPGTMNYALSRAVNRLAAIKSAGMADETEFRVSTETHLAMAEGFAGAVDAGYWGEDAASAEADFLAITAGSNQQAGSVKARKAQR